MDEAAAMLPRVAVSAWMAAANCCALEGFQRMDEGVLFCRVAVGTVIVTETGEWSLKVVGILERGQGE
jgi:hypothetical protein